MTSSQSRPRFALRWALGHTVVSATVALISALVVFGLWYPMPYRAMFGVGGIYLVVLVVDVVCGPLLTLVLASPRKSKREMALDLSLIALVQVAALAYGMHAVWIGRPVVLAFEVDRLVAVAATEIDEADLSNAPEGLRAIPSAGVLNVATGKSNSYADLIRGVELSLAGISPAMRPSMWQPIGSQHQPMRARAKPLAELIARRPDQADLLNKAAVATGRAVDALTYLPLTSSKTREWVALLDSSLEMVGYAPVDGF